jgi:hypothetical protein
VQNLPADDVKLFSSSPTAAENKLERLSYGSLIINVTEKVLPGKNALAFCSTVNDEKKFL